MTEQDLLQADADNRWRALDMDSFIVEAPAGAGKTELLTQRYLKLLAVVNEPEEIIAITFTNKAAAEMRNRVLQGLRDAADAVPIDMPHKQTTRELALAALARSTKMGWDVLAQPARLRINTIDSLCSSLARQMPLLSRFGAQPAVVEDASVHYQEAARRALAALEEETGEGVVTETLRYLDNDAKRLAELLSDMLARRDQWLHHAGREAMQHEVEGALRHLVQHDIARAAELLMPEVQLRLLPVARYAASNLAGDHALAVLLEREAPLPATPEALPLWRGMCELLLTQSGEFRKSVNVNLGFPAGEESKPHKQVLLDVIAGLPDPQPLARIRALPQAQCDAEELRIVGSFSQLLQLAAAHLWAVFQEAGEVDFVEVSRRALAALEDDRGATDLALRLDYRIRHLLVDEFQDTSPAQVQLLEKLTQGWEAGDGRTLFCVGDPMQSIYRFRKADVGLFLQASASGIGDLGLQTLHLTRNNRSSPAVVEWVNRAFARVFPPQDSVTRAAISYRPFAATREALPGAGVTVHPLVLESGMDNGEAAALEAGHVADLIEREHAEGAGRRIAVLVRARAHLDALVAEIRRHRPTLRFQAVEVEELAGRQTVQDVLALTHALYHRADRVHWLAVLRAPWCGLRLADLHALAADDHHSTLWQLMQQEDRLARLSQDGRARLLHVRGVLAEAFAQQGRQSARRRVESAWLRLGGPQCLWDAGDVRDVQAFFDLIDKLESNGCFDLAQLQPAMEKLYAAPDVQAAGTLQFMTIHKAKGLEFDTVILPGLHRAPKRADAPLLLWEEVAIGDAAPQLIAAPWVPKRRRDGQPSAHDYLLGLEQERAANETARLLYVAVTRSERRLHLVGVAKLDAKGSPKPPAGTFLELLWDTVGSEFLDAAPQAAPVSADEADAAAFIPKLRRLHQPAVSELLNVAAAPIRMPADDGLESSPAGSLDADCGTLAHRYLAMIADEGLERWPVARVRTLLPAMRRWLARRGHAAAEAAGAAERVAAMLSVTLDSEEGHRVLAAHGQAAAELALANAEGVHVMDRTFVEDGVRWVVDYKSADLGNAVSEEGLRFRAEDYRPQLERYAQLFAWEGLPVRKAVFFIAHGRLVEL